MEARERRANQLELKNSNLALRSPIFGTIMTPRPHDLIGSYLTDGQELVEVADLSVMRARIYVSEYQLNMIRNNAEAKIEVEGLSKKWNAETLSMAARPSEMDTRLMAESQLKGMNPPHYYLVDR